MRRRSLIALSLAISVLAALSPESRQARPPPAESPVPDRVIFFASDGMRPDLMEQYAAEGAHAHLRRPDGDRACAATTAWSRPSRRTPASAGTRWPPAPIRASTARRTTPIYRTGEATSTTGPVLGAGHRCRPIRSPQQPSAPARRSPRSTGSAAPTPDIAGPDGRLRQLLLDPRRAGGAAQRRRAGRRGGLRHLVPGRRVRAGSGWTNVPAGDPAAPPKQTMLTVATTFAAQNPTRIYDIYIYDSVVDGTAAYDHAILVRSGAAKDGSQAVGRPGGRRLQGDQADGRDGLIGARAGQTAGFYIKLITLAPDLSSVQALLHLGRARDRHLRHGRLQCAAGGRRWRGPAREVHRRQLADVHRRRLRAARSADHRRGHLRRAGPRPGDGLRRRGAQLHPRHAPAGHRPGAGRLPGHRRVPAPVHGAGHADRYRRRTRTRTTTTSTATASPDGRVDDPRGLHPQRLPRGGREAGAGARADGPDATVFAASDHGFAPQWYAVNAGKVLDATRRHLRRPSSPATAAPTAAPARSTWPRPAGPAARPRSTSTPTLPAGDRPTTQVRTADRRRLPEPDRPGQPGQAGRAERS